MTAGERPAFPAERLAVATLAERPELRAQLFSAAFAAAGVPTSMLFVRNEHGSRNPQEHMEIDDFLDACAVLTHWVVESAS